MMTRSGRSCTTQFRGSFSSGWRRRATPPRSQRRRFHTIRPTHRSALRMARTVRCDQPWPAGFGEAERAIVLVDVAFLAKRGDVRRCPVSPVPVAVMVVQSSRGSASLTKTTSGSSSPASEPLTWKAPRAVPGRVPSNQISCEVSFPLSRPRLPCRLFSFAPFVDLQAEDKLSRC